MPFFSLPAVNDAAHADDDDGLEPACWVGVSVPVDGVVARSDRAAVVLKRVCAYRDGFEFTITGVLHPSAAPDDGSVDRWGMGSFGRAVPDELLRVGLVWPDDRRATNLDEWGRNWLTDVDPEATHGLDQQGGSGSNYETSQDFWAWPLPETGTLQLVVEWPAYGIPETVTTLEGSLFAAAAERAYPVFEEQADRHSHHSRALMAAQLKAEATE